jgi:hypothetical protein
MTTTEVTKVTLRLDEPLIEAYAKLGAKRQPRRNPETEMAVTLRAAQKIDFGQRPLVIGPEARRDLEAIWETTIENEADLLKLVKNLARVEMEGVEIILTEHELSKLGEFASFHGEEAADYARRVLHDAVRREIGEW